MKSQNRIHSGAGEIRSWEASVESPVDSVQQSWSPGALHPALRIRGGKGQGERVKEILDAKCQIPNRGIAAGCRYYMGYCSPCKPGTSFAGMTAGEGWAKGVGIMEGEGKTDQLCQVGVTVLRNGGGPGEGRYGATVALERVLGMSSVLDTKERSEESFCPGDTDDISRKPYL